VAVQERAERGRVDPADPHVSYWATSDDQPIALARLACCDRYVCRCRQEEEEAEVTR